jgi:YaiO family outer membrane protein
MMRASAVLLGALIFAVPAQAQSAHQDYEAGVAARHAGHPGKAALLLRRAAQKDPQNSDIQVQLGFAYLAAGRLGEAEIAFRRTLDLAPAYDSAKLGLAHVAFRRGDLATAQAELDQIASPDADAEALRRQIVSALEARPWRWSIDFDGSYSQLNQGSDWRSAGLTLLRRFDDETTVAANLEMTNRHDHTDVYGEARIDYRFAPGIHFNFLLGGAPQADHRPELQVGAGTSIRVHDGPAATALRLDLRHADYATGPVNIVTPGLEQHIGGTVWVTVQWINVWDSYAYSSGWLARADFMPSERLRLFAGAADAPDLDTGTVVRTQTFYGGVSLGLGGGVSARLSFAHDDPEGTSNRDTLALGLGYRF